MKLRLLLPLALTGGLSAVPGLAAPLDLGTNITISDQNYNSSNPAGASNWYSHREDNETETNPNTITQQVWDLEGMFLNNGFDLTLVGGYDFKNGVLNDGHLYRSGDIFIDINGDAVFGHAANGGSGKGGWTTNSFGYDFVMTLDFTSMTFDVLQLTNQSTVFRGTDVASSNPWRYRSGGIALDGFQDVGFQYFSGLSNSDVGGLLGYGGNNTHYAVSVDTSFLGSGTAATFHYTMECGNDNLMGHATVPDAASTSFLLTGALTGLLGLHARRRRR